MSIRGLAEIVLWAKDLDRALTFYRDALGLRVMFEPDSRGAIFLQAGDPAIACPQQVVLVPLPSGSAELPRERERRSMHHVGFEVPAEEFEATRERLKSAGYDVRYGEHPFLSLKGLYLDDPDGNEVELISAR